LDRGITADVADGVYFFGIRDNGFIKQLQPIPAAGGVILRAKSYNKDYGPFDVTADMDFEVFSRILIIWYSEQV
jgi:phage repressor protein C with HTH and peptisase S24 domain